MGCSSSVALEEARHKQLRMRLSEKQIGIVQDTWPMLDKDLTAAGLLAFSKLFHLSPHLKPYFGMQENATVCLDDPSLIVHAGAFMSKLGEAVESLNDTERLADIVTSLGASHVDREIGAKDLSMLWPAVDSMLKDVMFYAYTTEVRDAWRTVFDFLIERMEIGMREAQEQRMQALRKDDSAPHQ